MTISLDFCTLIQRVIKRSGFWAQGRLILKGENCNYRSIYIYLLDIGMIAPLDSEGRESYIQLLDIGMVAPLDSEGRESYIAAIIVIDSEGRESFFAVIIVNKPLFFSLEMINSYECIVVIKFDLRGGECYGQIFCYIFAEVLFRYEGVNVTGRYFKKRSYQ